MADFLSSASTVINRFAFGNLRGITAEFDGSTAAANDTVQVPGMTQVMFAWCNPNTTLSSLLTSGYEVNVALPTSATTNLAQIVVSHTTIAGSTNLRWRYTAFGR